MKALKVFKGDITTYKAEAIVNAANSNLLAGGGVCGAIHKKAGKELEEYCKPLAPCSTGEAVLTPAFGLDSKYVIHAVGPRWYDGTRNEADLLAKAYDSIFFIVKENNIRSVAIPAISTGIYNFPLEQATHIAVERAKTFLKSSPDTEIIFVCFDDETFQSYYSNLKI